MSRSLRTSLDMVRASTHQQVVGDISRLLKQERPPQRLDTPQAHRFPLIRFTAYYAEIGIIRNEQVVDFVHALANDPSIWATITWQHITGYFQWQAAQRYSHGTVRQNLAGLRGYAIRAFEAGFFSQETLDGLRFLMTMPRGTSIGRHQFLGRIGPKPVLISSEQAILLKWQSDTPIGRRDALLMSLLLDHGLRGSEIVKLHVEDFLLPSGTPDSKFKFKPQYGFWYRSSPQEMSSDTKPDL